MLTCPHRYRIKEPFMKRFLNVSLQAAQATKKDLHPHAFCPEVLLPYLPPVIDRGEIHPHAGRALPISALNIFGQENE